MPHCCACHWSWPGSCPGAVLVYSHFWPRALFYCRCRPHCLCPRYPVWLWLWRRRCCFDSPAKIEHGKKIYRGSTSYEAKGHNNHVEGQTIEIERACTYKERLLEIKQALQSSISYGGGKDLSCFNSVKWNLIKTTWLFVSGMLFLVIFICPTVIFVDGVKK